MVKVCNACHQKNTSGSIYESGFDVDAEKSNRNKCVTCGGRLDNTNLTVEEYAILESVSDEVSLFEAMIKLKETDIIEFQLKMSQFKTQVNQSKQAEESNIPKCPTCSSTNIEKISLTKKAVGGAMFGLFSSNIRNTMNCKNCGCKW